MADLLKCARPKRVGKCWACVQVEIRCMHALFENTRTTMRTSNRFTVGSNQWLDDVFANGPARDVQGRSRPTQRYLTFGRREQIVGAEGGGASIARSLLETMQNAGVVSRFMLEAFSLSKAHHGIKATPDIIFQTDSAETYVIEVKSSRYLTAARIEKCRQVEVALQGSGMKYRLWTDTAPMPPNLWRLMREMRRLGFSNLTRESINSVVQAIAAQPLKVIELRSQGVYRDQILAAAWHGIVHFNLHAEFGDQTLISTDVRERQFSRFLTSTVKAHSWWNTLPQSSPSLKKITLSDKTTKQEIRHA